MSESDWFIIFDFWIAKESDQQVELSGLQPGQMGWKPCSTKPQGGTAFCCPATPATSSAISRFLFEGGISFRVPLSSLRSGWRIEALDFYAGGGGVVHNPNGVTYFSPRFLLRQGYGRTSGATQWRLPRDNAPKIPSTPTGLRPILNNHRISHASWPAATKS